MRSPPRAWRPVRPRSPSCSGAGRPALDPSDRCTSGSWRWWPPRPSSWSLSRPPSEGAPRPAFTGWQDERVAATIRRRSPRQHMDPRILGAYASKHGSTRGGAQVIGEVLQGAGLTGEVAAASTVSDLSPYDAVVLGSALYAAHWR